MNKSKIISQQEEKAIKRDNTCIRVVQGLCLALILVIQYTISYESTPSNYVSDSFMFMVCMLAAIIVVLEFCKEIKYYDSSTYVDEDYDDEDYDKDLDINFYTATPVDNTKDRPETLGELDCLKKFKKQKP